MPSILGPLTDTDKVIHPDGTSTTRSPAGASGQRDHDYQGGTRTQPGADVIGAVLRDPYRAIDSLPISHEDIGRHLRFEPDAKAKYALNLPAGYKLGYTFCVMTISVTDTGCGMTQGELAKLFQPFVQIEAGSRQKGGGTGLGLYLSRRIMEAHGEYRSACAALSFVPFVLLTRAN